jgi:hypothetical protein
MSDFRTDVLTFDICVVHNKAEMKTWTLRILVHLVSLLIVLPIGWCCWLPSAPTKEAAEPAESCCCPKKPAAPAKPNEEPREAPECCCDPQPATLNDDFSGKDDAKQLTNVLPVSLLDNQVTEVGGLHVEPPLLPTARPPLHLLHCVWLC